MNPDETSRVGSALADAVNSHVGNNFVILSGAKDLAPSSVKQDSSEYLGMTDLTIALLRLRKNSKRQIFRAYFAALALALRLSLRARSATIASTASRARGAHLAESGSNRTPNLKALLPEMLR